MNKISALGTGLENQETKRKTVIDVSKDTCETTGAKNESKSSSGPHNYFTEHLTGVFEEPPHESNWN
jgi:hypothetical protein